MISPTDFMLDPIWRDTPAKLKLRSQRGIFANHVIELRGYIGRVRGVHLSDFVERVAQGQFCGHESQRVAGRFGCQCRGTAQACIYLDYAVIVGVRIECVLDIAFTDDAQMADRLFRKFLQETQFFLVERAGRRHDNTLTGMDAQRIDVFHAGHREAVVVFYRGLLRIRSLSIL